MMKLFRKHRAHQRMMKYSILAELYVKEPDPVRREIMSKMMREEEEGLL